MKNITTYSIGIVVWIIINFVLLVCLTFNYINFLDIVKYRVEVYNAEEPVSFDLNEVKQAVELFKFLSYIGILYVVLTTVLLFRIFKFIHRR
ncbi:hypothetical protein CIL02_11620 [Prevotella sp. P3-122]|nr:hypothetical protein CIL02_11620 [Prevotella sp. P3-122]